MLCQIGALEQQSDCAVSCMLLLALTVNQLHDIDTYSPNSVREFTYLATLLSASHLWNPCQTFKSLSKHFPPLLLSSRVSRAAVARMQAASKFDPDTPTEPIDPWNHVFLSLDRLILLDNADKGDSIVGRSSVDEWMVTGNDRDRTFMILFEPEVSGGIMSLIVRFLDPQSVPKKYPVTFLFSPVEFVPVYDPEDKTIKFKFDEDLDGLTYNRYGSSNNHQFFNAFFIQQIDEALDETMDHVNLSSDW